jgi:hypothetical protein
MKRREFLKTGALVVVGAAAATSVGVAVAHANAAAPKFLVLTDEQAAAMLAMTRRIFPHRKVADAPYWKVVGEIDAAAKADPATAKLIAEGLAQLNATGTFTTLPEKNQTAALKAIETTAFFQKVKSVELNNLYNDPALWKAFGYQGPAFKYGGYIHRGFDDLAWLPNPPESASPKAS